MSHRQKNGAVFSGTLTPRYTDQDTWRHVNNSRAYQLHIEARIQALVKRFGPDAWYSDAERLRPLRTITQFREMSFFGSDIEFTVEVLGCDRTSVHLRTELHQNDSLVGIQDCLLVAFLNHEQVDLPEEVYRSFHADAEVAPHPLPEARYDQYAGDFSRFPVSRELTPRYADLDADSQRSEAAIARYMEQARFGTLRSIDMGGYGLLIAALDISFGHYRPSSKPVELVTGVSHIGNTSFHLTGGARSIHGVHAMANSVMVVVDLETNRPAPLTDEIREQLESLRL
ncbi:Acyl-CoA thioesterase FadM [Marinobacter daqiaonensis]|uniref:Acyl-CoA thioesterase FadM n=1 Tax=Marinobacter daqiaonensis TaxID=650891 RepID=A0A1I6INQ4_9GAMM|nr:thioesterase family protein [Marinobacter daqiaonensis]SFR68346.1 Acyl-CoA thioesterase FadM [Marinobacter daqiaonensis]